MLLSHHLLGCVGVAMRGGLLMALIANYRGIKRGDGDALRLAQRWSKYMAVTFAVGAVTRDRSLLRVRTALATVHGEVGEAFGVPFAFEGLFFFTEAIFISIYIYGWRRLNPGRISGAASRSLSLVCSAALR